MSSDHDRCCMPPRTAPAHARTETRPSIQAINAVAQALAHTTKREGHLGKVPNHRCPPARVCTLSRGAPDLLVRRMSPGHALQNKPACCNTTALAYTTVPLHNRQLVLRQIVPLHNRELPPATTFFSPACASPLCLCTSTSYHQQPPLQR